ncbi:MAG: Xaa-Pro peptidase family protein [Actinomycetota bacterium]|nr:Xaa-Pro peptidase family protein [Actinomycetota bacterium]
MFDYLDRRQRLAERMREARVDLLFLPPSSDLEYLTGVERAIPTFGQSQYAHGWVAGAFFRPEQEPVFVLPRMMTLFAISGELPGELVVVGELDDGPALFDAVSHGMGKVRTLAVGDRAWAETVLHLTEAVSPERVVTGSALVNELRRTKSPEELAAMERACRVCDETIAAVAPKVRPGATMLDLVEEVEHQMGAFGSRVPSFTTHVFTSFVGGKNSAEENRSEPIEEGDVVMFDFGAVVDGYCSDFGRTVCVGEPGSEVREAYALVLAAQEAGRAALKPGVPASEVNRACRQPIEEGGYGANFKHRMGHGIGLDVHELPFVSEEEETPLEAGMTFTDEPSILVDGRFGVRIEDVVVCEPHGGRKLNAFSPDLIVNA